MEFVKLKLWYSHADQRLYFNEWEYRIFSNVKPRDEGQNDMQKIFSVTYFIDIYLL